MTDDFNDALRRAYQSSRRKSARPDVFREAANATPEDVAATALRAGKSQAEADRLARRQAAAIGDGQTFGQMLRADHAAAQNRQRL
jgi:hypothetical protein